MTESRRSTLVFTDLSVNQPKEILKDVCGTATSGNILAVMGPSGSGKTTLLNALSGRINVSSGEITFNGSSFDKSQRRRLGYVLQDDVFLTNLTLWETLYFTAFLSISEDLSTKVKLERIQRTVQALGLQKCLHTVIGDIFTRGLSGGEKKRASIACELLRDPDILLVDEPTSGLDSSTAHNLMEQLRSYANDHNKTVVTTIHQPSSQVFHMFTDLLLLAEGRAVYFGSASSALDYLDILGIPYEDEYNPADILLDAVTSHSDTFNIIKQGGLHKRYNTLQSSRTPIQCQSLHGSDTPRNNEAEVTRSTVVEIAADDTNGTHRWPTSFWTQLSVLNWRSFKQAKGNVTFLDVAVPVVLAVTASLIYFRIGNQEMYARDKFGLVFFNFAFMGFEMCLATVRGLDTERGVVRKERIAGIYRMSAYYLSKMISEIPMLLINPVVMITIIYWVVGLGGVDGYVVYLSIGILYNLIIQGVGLVIGLSSSDLRFNMVTVFMCLNASLSLGGMYNVNPPDWIWWGKYLGFLHYPSAATLTYLMADMDPFWCNQTSVAVYPQCIGNRSLTLTSRDVLDGLAIELPVYFYVITMVIAFFVFRIVGYIVLQFKKF